MDCCHATARLQGRRGEAPWQSFELFAGHLLRALTPGQWGVAGSSSGCLEGARWDEWLQDGGEGPVEGPVGADTRPVALESHVPESITEGRGT